jgi:hypothetical protein
VVSPVDMLVIGVIVIGGAAVAAVLWWIAKGIKAGAQAKPLIEQAEDERDAAKQQARDLAKPPLGGAGALRVLRRLRGKIRKS